MKDFTKKKAVIVIHEYLWGPGHSLRDYLLEKKIKKLLFIAHPFPYLKDTKKKTSRYELYYDGKLVSKKDSRYWPLPEPLLYGKDILYTIFWSFQLLSKIDFFVGLDNLNALSGIILKLLGRTRSVIYYVIDYVPRRFPNMVTNSIYHSIEKIAASSSDWSWNLSERMVKAREQKWNNTFANQLIVPHGVYFERIKRFPYKSIHKYEILYMGILMEKQGIQLVIQTLPQVIKKIPQVHFTIIGKGPYEKELKLLAKKLDLQNHITFLGYIESHEEMEKRIAQAAIGIALYNRNLDKNDYTYYADPGKIKNYLGAGVPIIMTDVPLVARQIEKEKCGFIIAYDEKQLTKILITYFDHEEMMQQYRKNAIKFAKRYDWEAVFDKAFSCI